MPLVRVVYHDLLTRVTARSNQELNDGGQGPQLPGRQITMRAPNDCGVPKSPKNVERTSVQYICFRKTSGSNTVAPNLLLAQETQWRQTCFLPRAPSNLDLVMPLAGSNPILLSVVHVYEVRSCTIAWLRRS